MSQNVRKLISKLKLSSHKLFIETGRYIGVNRDDRICHKCNTGIIEDEFHFIIHCPFYANVRRQYLKPYYFRRPSAFKLGQLLSGWGRLLPNEIPYENIDLFNIL